VAKNYTYLEPELCGENPLRLVDIVGVASSTLLGRDVISVCYVEKG
jgi:hypothetical protein